MYLVLMHDQRHFRSPAIEADYYYTNREYLVDFFLQSGVEKLQA